MRDVGEKIRKRGGLCLGELPEEKLREEVEPFPITD